MMTKTEVIIASLLGINPGTILRIENWEKVFFVTIEKKGNKFISKSLVYKTDKNLAFRTFIENQVKDWQLSDLEFLSLKQLQSVCLVLGNPYTGTKSKLKERIKTIVKVRLIVRPFYIMANNKKSESTVENYDTYILASQFFAASYQSHQLRQFCKLVKTFAPPSKQAMANSLLNWLESSLQQGRYNYREAMKIYRKQKQEKKSANN